MDNAVSKFDKTTSGAFNRPSLGKSSTKSNQKSEQHIKGCLVECSKIFTLDTENSKSIFS